MSQSNKIAVVLEMLESAQSSLRSARAMLAELAGMSPAHDATVGARRPLSTPSEAVSGRIIEGTFDGQNMVGSDKRTYPVPPNYASKSKLVQGDVLKLTITDEGSFIYKQIGPAPRRSVVGTVAFEDGQYKIIAEGSTYRILMASVTFYKLEVGQQVTVLLPQGMEAEWATLDNILPPGHDAEDAAPEAPADPAPEPAAPKRRTKKTEAAE